MILRKVFQTHVKHFNQTYCITTSNNITNLFSTQRCKIQVQATKDVIYEGNDINEGKSKAQEKEFLYMDVPRPGRKWERKPYLTPMKVLIQRSKEEKIFRKENPCHMLEEAPNNGLLVPELLSVAHNVYFARESILGGLSLLLDHHSDAFFVHRCRFCREVHIGKNGHEIKTCDGPKGASRNAIHIWGRGGINDIIYFPKSYHIYDRVMHPRVGHKERFKFPILPAVVELCIQAGLDLKDYPTRRRTKPVYSIEGRIVDFEVNEDDDSNEGAPLCVSDNSATVSKKGHGFILDEREPLHVLGTKILNSWLEMKFGVGKIIKKYSALTCGYCNAVHVGPKGHKVRSCKATGHQYRDGLHAWQEATIDDLIGHNYVWHVGNPYGPPLENELKRYHGKAPAIVELCVQLGAPVPLEYWSMMRLDVVTPCLDEHDLVA